MGEYARLAFANIADLLEIDSEGKPTLKRFDQLSRGQTAGIAEVWVGRDGQVRVKMHSKANALEGLTRVLGMAKSHVDISVNRAADEMTIGELSEIVRRSSPSDLDAGLPSVVLAGGEEAGDE